MAFMVDQLVEMQQAFAVMNAKYKNKAKSWKKKYKNSKKGLSDAKKLKGITSQPPDSYQKVTGKEKINAAIDDGDHSDPNPSSITLQEVEPSEESDNELTSDSSLYSDNE